MPYLEQIVDCINKELDSSLKNFGYQKTNLFGIAERYPAETPEQGKTVTIRPFVFDNNGDAVPVEFDEVLDLQAYHRVLSAVYSDDNSITSGRKVVRQCITDMLMIVSVNRKTTQRTPSFFEAFLESAFPSSLSKELMESQRLVKLKIQLSSSTLDQNQVFLTEYSGIPFFIKPGIGYFSIRYKITTSFITGCFAQCK